MRSKIFWGQKLEKKKNLQVCERAHYRATRKNLENRNPLSESEELALGMFKEAAIILDAIGRPFFIKAATAATFPQFESILDGHHSRHRLSASFRLEIVNTT
jgi:hypothetical protein